MKVPNGIQEIIATYGDPDINKDGKPDPKWEEENLEYFTLPTKWDMVLAWNTEKPITRMKVHKVIIPTLAKTFNELWNFARIRAKDKYGYNKTTEFYDVATNEQLKMAGMNLYGGAYNFRLKRGGTTLSTHSFGIAIDFDPANNSMGDTTPKIPIWVVEIFEENGWTWGGRWEGRGCDGMHFQLCKGY